MEMCITAYSRLENGMIRFAAGYTGIKGTIAKAVGSVFSQASAKKIELSVEEFQDFNLYHNPKWTAEAMSNILENAVKYSPESEFNRIFQRFYRGGEVEQQEGSSFSLFLLNEARRP